MILKPIFILQAFQKHADRVNQSQTFFGGTRTLPALFAKFSISSVLILPVFILIFPALTAITAGAGVVVEAGEIIKARDVTDEGLHLLVRQRKYVQRHITAKMKRGRQGMYEVWAGIQIHLGFKTTEGIFHNDTNLKNVSTECLNCNGPPSVVDKFNWNSHTIVFKMAVVRFWHAFYIHM